MINQPNVMSQTVKSFDNLDHYGKAFHVLLIVCKDIKLINDWFWGKLITSDMRNCETEMVSP